MRFYDIQISTPASVIAHKGFRSTVAPEKPFRRYTSFVNGRNNPAALNVELDLPVTVFAEPFGQDSTGCFVRIWGIPLTDIAQATDFGLGIPDDNGNQRPGKLIKIYAGMQKGLPLANPAQIGPILNGSIVAAWGNWVGTTMTLDFKVVAVSATESQPKNIVLNWPAGTSLGDAVAQALAIAFPGVPADVNVTKIVRADDVKSYYSTVTELALDVQALSFAAISTPAYPGIQILDRDGRFSVFDGSTKQTPKEISFTDLVGQPTWSGYATMNIPLVMRGDLMVGDYIKMPQTLIVQTAAQQQQDKSAFTGVFSIQGLRHVGNFRQPSGESWLTVVDANALSPADFEVQQTFHGTAGPR